MKKKKKDHKNPREQKRGSRALAMPAERASSTRQLRLVDRMYEDDKCYLVTEKVLEPEPTASSDPGKHSSSVFGRRAHDLGTGDDGHRPSHTQAVVHDSGEKSLGMDSVQTHLAVREDCIHQILGAQLLRDLGDCCRRSTDGGHTQANDFGTSPGAQNDATNTVATKKLSTELEILVDAGREKKKPEGGGHEPRTSHGS